MPLIAPRPLWFQPLFALTLVGLSPALGESIKPQNLGGVSLGFGTLGGNWGDLLLPVGSGSLVLPRHLRVQVPEAGGSSTHRVSDGGGGVKTLTAQPGPAGPGPSLPDALCLLLGLGSQRCFFFPIKNFLESPPPFLLGGASAHGPVQRASAEVWERPLKSKDPRLSSGPVEAAPGPGPKPAGRGRCRRARSGASWGWKPKY